MGFDRNTILAFSLAIIVLLGWEFFVAPKMAPKPPVEKTVVAPPPATDVAAPVDGAVQAAPEAQQSTGEPEKRISISTPSLHGSFSLTGGRFDDISLVKYHETLDPKSPEIALLSPTMAQKPYYAE